MAAVAPRHVLVVLVVAQFTGTSLWFAINAVLPELSALFGWPEDAAGLLSASLQGGFIVGTLCFALTMLSDRFDPRHVFLIACMAGAVCTLVAWQMVRHYEWLVVWRFLTGVCLAGIYPVGMKIAAQWFPGGLGRALGWLVGALVVGSASAHGLRAVMGALPWDTLMLAVAALAALGGLLIRSLPTPPPPLTASQPTRFAWSAFSVMWTNPTVRSSVLGYFGHMWELYTFWVLLPFILMTRVEGVAVLWWSFFVMASGAVGCVVGGAVANRWGSARVAGAQLSTSGLCCLLAPVALTAGNAFFFAWLIVWGITVAGDSPQFSTLTARHTPAHLVGSVLTMTNSIGFALSIVSIVLFTQAMPHYTMGTLLPWLALGPVLGVWALKHTMQRRG